MSERHIAYRRGDTLLVLSDPGQYSDPEVQTIVALRNQATIANICPACGARGPNREQRRRLKQQRGQVNHAYMLHERECPVSDDAIRALFARKGVQL